MAGSLLTYFTCLNKQKNIQVKQEGLSGQTWTCKPTKNHGTKDMTSQTNSNNRQQQKMTLQQQRQQHHYKTPEKNLRDFNVQKTGLSYVC